MHYFPLILAGDCNIFVCDCACSANEVFPELKGLQPLPVHEMALRLCFVFDHYNRNPVYEDVK